MSVSIPAVPSTVPPWRFDGRADAAPVQSQLPGSADVSETGFDGHVKVPDYFALWLALLELMQEQRAADRAMASKVGLVAQDLSRAQAQHVRDEGVHIFGGALAGAAMGIAIGTVGAVISHRALGKQLGSSTGSSTRPDSVEDFEAPQRPVSHVDVDDPAPLPAARSRNPSDVMAFYSETRGASGSTGSIGSERRVSVSSRVSARGDNEVSDGSEGADWTRRRDPSDVMAFYSETRRVSGSTRSLGSERRASVSSRASAEGDNEIPEGNDGITRSESLRGLRSESEASVSRRANARGDDEVADGNDGIDRPHVDAPGNADDHHSDHATSYDVRRATGRGLVGQMLMANAASLAAVGAAGGQMVAAMDRADSGLTQTSGMISESTKHNRSEEARQSNEATTRTLSGLRGMNDDLRQTLSQIISSIKA